MSSIRRGWSSVMGSRGVILLMSLIMGAITLVTLRDHALRHLPMRPALVLLSTLAAVIGFGVTLFGREPRAVGWVGATWFAYYGIRAGSWLSTGSFTGVVVALPGMLLGAVVFDRRHGAPEGGDGEGRPS